MNAIILLSSISQSVGYKELSISAPGLVNGINAVTLSVDDEKIDSKKFVK